MMRLAATYSHHPPFLFLTSIYVIHSRRPLMSVLVSRVRKACKLSMHQIMLLHRYVRKTLIRKGQYRFIYSLCAQFRFLKRLLFVHGHWSYARNGNM